VGGGGQRVRTGEGVLLRDNSLILILWVDVVAKWKSTRLLS
jgi:hypothetical protein